MPNNNQSKNLIIQSRIMKLIIFEGILPLHYLHYRDKYKTIKILIIVLEKLVKVEVEFLHLQKVLFSNKERIRNFFIV